MPAGHVEWELAFSRSHNFCLVWTRVFCFFCIFLEKFPRLQLRVRRLSPRLIKISAWPRSTQTCARPRRRHLYCYCFSGRLRAHTLTHPCPYWYSYLRRSTPLFTFPHFPPGRRGQGTDAFHGSSSLKQARAANMKLLNFHTLPGLKTIRKNERRNRNRNGRCILHSFPN